jgi:hypothetical protein
VDETKYKNLIYKLIKNEKFKSEGYSVFLTIFFLALGFFIIWFSENYLPFKNNVIYSFLLLLPMFIYMLFSGKISEFKAPGGLEAKFVNISKKSLELTDSEIINIDRNPIFVYKDSTSKLFDKIRFFDKTKPIFLALMLGKSYTVEDCKTYLETLSRFRTFKFVVLLKEDGKFLAFMRKEILHFILNSDGDAFFLYNISNGAFEQLIDLYPFNFDKTEYTKSNYIKSLREMAIKDLDAIAIVDENDKLYGIIEREDILTKIVLELIK